MQKITGKSLALQKFNKSIEAEIRNFWHINASLEYSERWWKAISKDKIPKRLSLYPGDNKNPFTSIDLPPDVYLKHNPQVIRFTGENAIVGFITAFEVYLLDVVRRCIFLNPKLVDDSKMPFEAQEVANVIGRVHMGEWFSNKMASKYMRNKTHIQMIDRIQSLIKYNFASKDLIDEWDDWTYVRNAIVHNGREISEELAYKWSSKFPNSEQPLNLTSKDMIRVHYLAFTLAKSIDQKLVEFIIHDEDAILLIREIFIKEGIDDSKLLAKRIFDTLGHKLKIPDIDKALGYQRKTNAHTHGWIFSHYNFV